MSEASQKRYLSCISEQFPTVQSLYTEIINLKAILNLPKGTEHFMSDIHGEYDAFLHILNNCSGVVRERSAAAVLLHPQRCRDFRSAYADLLPQGKAQTARRRGKADPRAGITPRCMI